MRYSASYAKGSQLTSGPRWSGDLGKLFRASYGGIPSELLPGFAINTFFYAAILALPLSVFPIRRRLRARRGRCPKCGYDLAGLRGVAQKAGKGGADPGAPCPECGRPDERRRPTRPARDPPRRRHPPATAPMRGPRGRRSANKSRTRPPARDWPAAAGGGGRIPERQFPQASPPLLAMRADLGHTSSRKGGGAAINCDCGVLNPRLWEFVEAQRSLAGAAAAPRPSLRGLAGKTVLLTGSGGSIGSELARQLSASNVGRLVLMDCCEAAQFRLQRSLAGRRVALEFCLGDITDPAPVRDIFEQWRPQVTLHAAAYKHVPFLESHPREAIRVNVLGTKLLADAAEQWGCRSFVMISTDKAVEPVGVMGCSKRIAELYLRAKGGASRCVFTSVRFGNVLDSSGNVIETFRYQIEQGGPVTLTDPRMTRYFMTVREAAHLVLSAAMVDYSGKILVLDMGRQVRIEAIAREMIRLAGGGIEIALVGPRPGERLHEQLLAQAERRVATDHPRIGIAHSDAPDGREVASAIRQLQAALSGSADALRRLVIDVVNRHEPACRQGGSAEVESADARL